MHTKVMNGLITLDKPQEENMEYQQELSGFNKEIQDIKQEEIKEEKQVEYR